MTCTKKMKKNSIAKLLSRGTVHQNTEKMLITKSTLPNYNFKYSDQMFAL